MTIFPQGCKSSRVWKIREKLKARWGMEDLRVAACVQKIWHHLLLASSLPGTFLLSQLQLSTEAETHAADLDSILLTSEDSSKWSLQM